MSRVCRLSCCLSYRFPLCSVSKDNYRKCRVKRDDVARYKLVYSCSDARKHLGHCITTVARRVVPRERGVNLVRYAIIGISGR